MESRIARLESDVSHIKSSIEGIDKEIRGIGNKGITGAIGIMGLVIAIVIPLYISMDNKVAAIDTKLDNKFSALIDTTNKIERNVDLVLYQLSAPKNSSPPAADNKP